MIPLTANELAILVEAKAILEAKNLGTAVMVMDMVLRLSVLDDPDETRTEIELET